jgi:hypothetical protein
MLMLRRYVVVLLAILAAASLAPAPALAEDGAGGTTCTNPSAPECHVEARSPGQPGNNTEGQNGGNGGDNCEYLPADLTPETIEVLGGQPAGEGGWYFKSCTPDHRDGELVWIPGAPPVVSPAVLAQQARSRLRLPGW